MRRSFERFLESIVIALMASLAVLVVAGVAFRKAGAALAWYDEVASVLLAWLTFYGACLAAYRRAHIGFGKVVEMLPPSARRWVVVIREAIVIGFFLVAGWAGVTVLRVLGGDALVTLPWVPTRLTHSVIPIGAVLFIIAELLSLRQERPA